MEMKFCKKCGEVKALSEFYKHKRDGYQPSCKGCQKVVAAERYTKNKERSSENRKKWRSRNAERTRQLTRAWRAKNPDKTRENCRKSTAKRRSTAAGRLNHSLSSSIRYSLKKGLKAGRHWENLVGYTAEQFRKHLEKQFSSGMTWENYGVFWEIDHRTPIAAFNFERPEDIDFKKCWSLKNLRPLEVKENMQKHAKIDRPFQPALTL